MTRPVLVSFCSFEEVVRLHYSLRALCYYEETADDWFYTLSFAYTDCSLLYNTHLAGCIGTLPLPFEVFCYISIEINELSLAGRCE